MFKKNQSLQSLELTELGRRLDSIQKQIQSMQSVSKSNPQSMESIPAEIPPAKSTTGGAAGSEDVLVEEQDLPPE